MKGERHGYCWLISLISLAVQAQFLGISISLDFGFNTKESHTTQFAQFSEGWLEGFLTINESQSFQDTYKIPIDRQAYRYLYSPWKLYVCGLPKAAGFGFMCLSVFPRRVPAHHIFAVCLCWLKEGIRFPGTGVADGFEQPCRC